MVYRAADPPPEDAEAVALEELARRARRVRGRVLLPALIASVLGGVALYLAVRELQFALFNVHFPWGSAVVVAAFLGAAFRFSARLADAAIAARAPAWREELAEEHELEVSSLEELTRFL